MNNQIPTIKAELERRYSLIIAKLKNRVFRIKYTSVSFPHVYDYLYFINHNPLLQDFVQDEHKQFDIFLAKLKQQEKTKEETEMQLATYRHFNLWQSYDLLNTKVFEPILKLGQETDKRKLDPWALALTKNPVQIFFQTPLPMFKWFKLVSCKMERSDFNFQRIIKNRMANLHQRLLNMLVEYEALPNKGKVILPTESVKELGLNKQTKWQDLQISFTSEFLVKISYKNKELSTDHEKMGFADNRTPNLTRAKASWEWLRLLAVDDGIFPLGRLSRKEKAKRKKQKQELSRLLKKYFQIKSDPFHAVDKDNIKYKIKIKLIPESEFRDDWKDKDIWDDSTKTNKSLLMDI